MSWTSLVGLMVVLSALLCVAALAWVPPGRDVVCFDPLLGRSPITPAERRAFADAHARLVTECTGPWRQCSFSVRASGETIAVSVDAASVRQDSCLYMPADGALYMYDLTGSYKESGLVL